MAKGHSDKLASGSGVGVLGLMRKRRGVGGVYGDRMGKKIENKTDPCS